MENENTIYSPFTRNLYRLGNAVYATDDAINEASTSTSSSSTIQNIATESSNISTQTTGFKELAAGLIMSANFVSGSGGWIIRADGSVEFSNGVFRGTIVASGGTIGGFTISSTALYAGTGATRIQLDTTSGIHLGATAFASAPFGVSLDGALTATNATITGSISATTGSIGGFSIGATTITSTGLLLTSGTTSISFLFLSLLLFL